MQTNKRKPLVLIISAALLTTLAGCGPKVMDVRPVEPSQAPKIRLPEVLKKQTLKPDWLESANMTSA